MNPLLALAISALVFSACAEIKPGPKPKDLPQISKTFIPEMIAHAKVGGIKIKVYDTAILKVSGNQVSSLKSRDAHLRLSVPAFLINHPKQGLILVDTGPRPGIKSSLYEMRPGGDILSQLRADSVDPESVKWVILSHLHIDRAALAGAFPNATVVADKREWLAQQVAQAQRSAAQFIDVGEIEPKIKLSLIDLADQPPFASFDHGKDFFNDGTVFLLDLSGHTDGTMGVWINLDSGPVLLSGGAASVLDNYQDLALPDESMISDVARYTRRLHQMRAAQDAVPQLVIFPGNDLTPLRLQPRDDVAVSAK